MTKQKGYFSGGFSLIEVMIGVGILAGVALLINTTVVRALNSKQILERRQETFHGIRSGLEKMTYDLSQAFVVSAELQGKQKDFGTGMKGDNTEINFSTMSHFHFVEDGKDTEHVNVGYFLKKNERGFYDLMRRETQRLGKDLDQGGESFVIIHNVKDLKFEYYDASGHDWKSEWSSSGLSVLGRLPAAVKITLHVVELEDDDKSDQVLREYEYSTMAKVGLYDKPISF